MNQPDGRTKHGAVGPLGWLAIVFLVALLGASIWFAAAAWQATDGVVISTHGKIAMGLGIVVTILLGVGLMALVFWSNRKGYDR